MILQLKGIWKDLTTIGLKNTIISIPLCAKCSVYISTLIIGSDLFTASLMALIWWVIEKIIDLYYE